MTLPKCSAPPFAPHRHRCKRHSPRRRPPDTDIDPEINARYAEEAKQAYRELTAKQQFVDTYVRQTWNLDLRRLQVRTVRRLNSFVQQQRSHD